MPMMLPMMLPILKHLLLMAAEIIKSRHRLCTIINIIIITISYAGNIEILFQLIQAWLQPIRLQKVFSLQLTSFV